MSDAATLPDLEVNLPSLHHRPTDAAGDMSAVSDVSTISACDGSRSDNLQMTESGSQPPLSPQRPIPPLGRGKALLALGVLSPEKSGLKTGVGRGKLLMKLAAQVKSPRESDYESDSSSFTQQTIMHQGVKKSPSSDASVLPVHLSPPLNVNTNNIATYGVGARPKGSIPIKVNSLKDALGKGSSDKVKRPKPSGGESSGNENTTKTDVIPKVKSPRSIPSR